VCALWLLAVGIATHCGADPASCAVCFVWTEFLYMSVAQMRVLSEVCLTPVVGCLLLQVCAAQVGDA
jgi:hypothetical protein